MFNRLLRGQSRCKTTQQCSAFSQALTLCVLPFLFKKETFAKSWIYLAFGGPFYSSSSSQYSSAYLASQLSPNIWERMFRWQIFYFSAENNKKNGPGEKIFYFSAENNKIFGSGKQILCLSAEKNNKKFLQIFALSCLTSHRLLLAFKITFWSIYL